MATTPRRPGKGDPMYTFTMIVEGDTVIERRLRALDERASDPSPAWPFVQQEFFAVVAEAFATEGLSTGAPWPDLADATARERSAQGYLPYHPILERSGALLRSLTTLDANAVLIGTPQTLMLGSAVPYFKYHQSSKPRKRLPRRAPVQPTGDQIHAIMRPVRRYVTGNDPGAAVRRKPRAPR